MFVAEILTVFFVRGFGGEGGVLRKLFTAVGEVHVEVVDWIKYQLNFVYCTLFFFRTIVPPPAEKLTR